MPNPWAIASREGHAARLQLLADLAGKLIGAPDSDSVLALLVERAPVDLGLDVCISYTADEERRLLKGEFVTGVSDQLREILHSLPYGTGLCGKVAETRQPLVVRELVYSDLPEAQLVRRNGFRTYAAFPLMARGGETRLLGVLSFASKRIDAFTESDLVFFATIASYVEAVRQRVQSDRALKDSEARFRTLADSIPNLAWMARPDGGIFWFNQRWLDYTGTTLDEMQGWGWRRVQHPDHIDRVVGRIQHSWDTGEPWEDTFPMLGKDGEWRWFLSRALPVRDPCGRIAMWFGTNTDVTEQRESAEALKAARDEAEAARREAEGANQTKSRFLAAASHDLRQPLQSMLLLTGVLEQEVTSKRGREVLLHLQRGMDALKSLLDGLLDVSRLDAGVVEVRFSEFNLDEVIDQVTSTFEPVATGKGLDWRAGHCGLTVCSDPTLLRRVVGNLVENAVRYTDTGSVSLSCSASDDSALLMVEDTGIGIPAEHLDRIWDEFHQVGNVERDRSQGTGLGLAIVRRLSALLGVRIELDSAPGRGSRFRVSVPLGAATPQEEPAPAPIAAPAAAGEGRLALVIDDDAMILLGLQSILHDWGYQVLIAGSGDQALERLREAGRSPDVVVSDYRLRAGELGTDAIKRVRDQSDRPIPGVVLTGEAGTQAQEAAVRLGLGFVHKPVTPRQLASAMGACLEKIA